MPICAGTPLHCLYRDEVQDFTQGELLLDMRVCADPNALFYCGDTAQTIARGIGFRFVDIQTLFHDEGSRRKERGGAAAAVRVATPPIMQLTTNYRTHNGVLQPAAEVVEMLKLFFPKRIDELEREQARETGPSPLLLGSVNVDDLGLLLSGSDRSRSTWEFGANQVKRA